MRTVHHVHIQLMYDGADNTLPSIRPLFNISGSATAYNPSIWCAQIASNTYKQIISGFLHKLSYKIQGQYKTNQKLY